ncbi:HD domain-containing protein [Desulfosporosinus sp. PR]|uniref:HD domain-containing protein n=1 Tax=Candidatus Desulfosporosinus nitrosoreducens TaxID=3401928 RepID=UPI0027F8931B|nr:HD domain-containing protein [Desulfosporosinus sp. PR]MDQ7096073.1 HD domain-containing protein [Desulfosporosinus sp. PR]
MFYRIHQFAQAFFPRLHPSETLRATKILSPGARALFFRQSPAEQRHALSVAQSLMIYQEILSSSEYLDLITAALLHDCGKSLVTIRLWQRVFIVLMQQMPDPLWIRAEKGPALWSAPLKVAKRHPLWGANLARKAGLNPRICLLIREHHTPGTRLGCLLHKADNEH